MKNQKPNANAEERVSFLGVKRRWVGYALFIFVTSVLIYAGFSAADYLSTDGWRGFKTVRAILHDTSQALPSIGVVPIVILVIWEFIMILYEIVKEQIEARQKARITAHEERGEKRGEKRGRELEREEWVEWNNRRKAAAEAGEPFTEPDPGEKRNGTPPPAT